MSFTIVAAAGLAMGAGKMIAGGVQTKKAKKRQQEAKDQMDKDVEKYMTKEIRNPYANMENTMEDLTVNTQAADFAAQKSEQARADIMSNMNQAAGGSGIAALAQTMANQAQQEAQKASSSIAEQELANEKAERKEAGNLQELEVQGDVMVDNLERDRLATKVGMSSAEVMAENQAVQSAEELMQSGASDIGGAVGGMDLGTVGGLFKRKS